ncbi:MAG: Maf family protein [Desulfohalobiaceae bacterium]
MPETLPRGPFRSRKDIVLASASPRRQELLQRLGLDFLVRISDAREPDWTENAESPENFVLSAARSKAESVLPDLPHGVVLAADTVIALDGNVLGKAESREQALSILQRLAGRTHTVLTGCCLADKHGHEETFVVGTDVAMPALEESTLRAYVDTGEYEGKAGAYAIQGVGSFLVRGISGSYTNVVGLPLQEVLFCLQRMEAVETLSEGEA